MIAGMGDLVPSPVPLDPTSSPRSRAARSCSMAPRRADLLDCCRCAMTSSRAARTDAALDALSARWPPASGLCGEEVCGNHFSHSSSLDQCGVTSEATASSAGECRAVS